MKTMMKLSLVAVAVLMVGCVKQNTIYSHTDKGDFLTKDSRGDNLADYSDLRAKADDMCRSEGFKNGINVLDARPGNPIREGGISSYTLTYQCKSQEPGITETLTSAYDKVKKQFSGN
jgi:hypothetical protein